MVSPATSARKPSPRPWSHLKAARARRSFHQLAAGDGFKILVENLIAGFLAEIERLQNAQRLARIHRSVFRIERAIGSEHDLVNGEELKAALGRRRRSEHRGIGIEVLLEIVERALLQALAQRDVVLVGRARAEHVPARPDAALK